MSPTDRKYQAPRAATGGSLGQRGDGEREGRQVLELPVPVLGAVERLGGRRARPGHAVDLEVEHLPVGPPCEQHSGHREEQDDGDPGQGSSHHSEPAALSSQTRRVRSPETFSLARPIWVCPGAEIAFSTHALAASGSASW